MKSRTEQDGCCIGAEWGVTDFHGGSRARSSFFLVKSNLLVQQQQRKDRSGLSSFGEKRIDCRISPPSPPFSLMGGETEEACSTS